MSSYSYPQSKPKQPDSRDKPCSDCDVSDFDSVNCEVEGDAAEAEYMKKYTDKLKERRTQFDTARTSYGKARQEVTADLGLISQQLKRIRDQLECHLEDAKEKCLTDAWREVAEQLGKCGREQGCCVTEDQCRFEWDLGEYPKAPEIRALIEDFERRVVAAEYCFDEVLVKEPEKLKTRVADLKTFVDAIGTTAGDPKSTDYARAFAELLWAEHRRRTVWLGFDDPDDYLDCLCLALNCSLQGRRALAKLTGLLKTLDCKDKWEADRCTWLKAHVVDEILAVCRRICPPGKYDESAQTAG